MRGISNYPRLIEFENSHFLFRDFEQHNMDFITAGGLEFARVNQRRWVTPDKEVITHGEVIKRIYALCNPEILIDIYTTDTNPAYPRLMRLKKVFTYRLSVNTPATKRLKATYDLECLDDVKVLHSLEQAMELEFGKN